VITHPSWVASGFSSRLLRSGRGSCKSCSSNQSRARKTSKCGKWRRSCPVNALTPSRSSMSMSRE
jgi:hypothetical protein